MAAETTDPLRMEYRFIELTAHIIRAVLERHAITKLQNISAANLNT